MSLVGKAISNYTRGGGEIAYISSAEQLTTYLADSKAQL